jgi:hypothetical protein
VAAVLSLIWTAVAACVGSVTAFYRQSPFYAADWIRKVFGKADRRSNVYAIMGMDIHGINS